MNESRLITHIKYSALMNATFFFLVFLLLFLLPFDTLNKNYIYSKPNTPFFLPPFWPPQCGAYPFFTCLLQTVDGNNNICPDCDSSRCTPLSRFPSNTFDNRVFRQPQTFFFLSPPLCHDIQTSDK